ncbi:hypothetical protein [Nocardia sp. NBC_01327]|uniref:hypothetical protein n=1 Tax=Nocardia sp. NBC_01327 TaxID=2903593 RepID=UPI002E108623|nr:hypothetical protein OG326_42335 [Nocardia sp. NBC_01327]
MVVVLGDVGEPEDSALDAGPARSLPAPAWPPRQIRTPVTDIPQMAAAAHARGDTDRVILVDVADPPVIATPGRTTNQWLLSGAFAVFPVPCRWCGWWRDGACECPPEL